MLSQHTPLDEIIHSRYQIQFDQLAQQMQQEQNHLLQTITPLEKAERQLVHTAEIVGLQREILCEALAYLPLTEAAIAQLNQDYQIRLQALKNDLLAGYQVLLNARNFVFENAAQIPLNAVKRSELLEEFNTELDQQWPEYKAFQILATDAEKLSAWQARLTRRITAAIEEVEALQLQKTLLVELITARRAFLGMQQQTVMNQQQAIIQDPHYRFLNACIAGNLVEVQRLLETNKKKSDRKVFTNRLGVDGRNALHQACGHGHYVIVKYLLEQGANPQAADSEGYQPLHYAGVKPTSCTTTILEVLWRHTPTALRDSNAAGPYKRTPLHTAALFGNLPAVTWLVRQGADLNRVEQGATQRTPLHNAASKGHSEVVQCLLEAGASPFIENANQESPLFEALYYGHETIAQLFAERRVGLTPNEKKELLHLLPNRPILQHCLKRFLQPEVDLYARASELAATHALTTFSHPISVPPPATAAAIPASQLAASLSSVLNNNNNNNAPTNPISEQQTATTVRLEEQSETRLRK